MPEQVIVDNKDLLDLVRAVESLSAMQDMLRHDVDRLNSLVKDSDVKPSILETLALLNSYINNLKSDIELVKQDILTIRENMNLGSKAIDVSKSIEGIKETMDQRLKPLEKFKEKASDRDFQWLKLLISFLLGAGLQVGILILTGKL